ncbi:hypothetical protein BLA29_008344 [Euroglyphus maynei]|uniref:Dehydrogenase/reductase SDR family protein 7-like protein n=1 Tax=Euroglyphus maynei TaxID=6958 RepID=A0A1Y3ANB7_EURMA|nr:hypothetical protein BLA29_008344 [Euroglyphus maynei]
MILFTIFIFILLLLIIYRSLFRSWINCFSPTALKYLNGKTVCVTGASSGLGKEIARIFYEHGAHVILAARRTDELERVKTEFLANSVKKFEPEIIRLDLSSAEQSEMVARKISEKFNVDILVNNAGISSRAQALDTVIDVDERLITVNFLGHIAFTKIILKSMIESGRKDGKILAISSIQDRFAIPFRSSYSSSKHALRAWYDSLRSELSLISPKILISLLSPGYIRTNISMNAINSDGTKYGRMDETTASGHTPEYVATISIEMLLNDQQERILAPFIHRFLIIIRTLWPNLYFFIMKIYAKKQKSKSS